MAERPTSALAAKLRGYDRGVQVTPIALALVLASPPTPADDNSPFAEPIVCRREDFKDFDAFVACRMKNEATQAPAPRSPARSAADEHQAEIDEANEARHSGSRAEVAEADREAGKFIGLGVGLMVPGVIAGITGAVLAIAGSAGGGGGGDRCSTGKPCGDACISQDDVCHIPADDDGGREARPALLAAGITVALVGVGLIIGSVFALRRGLDARRRSSDLRRGVHVTARGLVVRF